MSNVALSDRQVLLLKVVAEGGGLSDARRIDITFSSRHGAGETTVLRQLEELKRLGLVSQDTKSPGVGGCWAITSDGEACIEAAGAPRGEQRAD